MKKDITPEFVIMICLILLFFGMFYFLGYNVGWNKGFDKGYVIGKNWSLADSCRFVITSNSDSTAIYLRIVGK